MAVSILQNYPQHSWELGLLVFNLDDIIQPLPCPSSTSFGTMVICLLRGRYGCLSRNLHGPLLASFRVHDQHWSRRFPKMWLTLCIHIHLIRAVWTSGEKVDKAHFVGGSKTRPDAKKLIQGECNHAPKDVNPKVPVCNFKTRMGFHPPITVEGDYLTVYPLAMGHQYVGHLKSAVREVSLKSSLIKFRQCRKWSARFFKHFTVKDSSPKLIPSTSLSIWGIIHSHNLQIMTSEIHSYVLQRRWSRSKIGFGQGQKTAWTIKDMVYLA